MKKNIKPTGILALRFRNAMIRLLFFCIAVLVCAWFLLECRVQTLTVENLNHVAEPTVIDAVNIRPGRHLFAIREKKLVSNVTACSPYIRSVSFKRTLPTTVTISVEEYDLAYFIFFEGTYYLLSADLIVLEETTPEDAAYYGAAPLLMPPITAPKPEKDAPENVPVKLILGKTPTFKTKSDLAWSQALLKSIHTCGFSDKITSVDISDPFEIRLSVSDKYEILLGNEKDMDKKLARVNDALNYLSESIYGVKGTIFARSDAPVTFEIKGTISNGVS